jgi:hypothetical protein
MMTILNRLVSSLSHAFAFSINILLDAFSFSALLVGRPTYNLTEETLLD